MLNVMWLRSVGPVSLSLDWYYLPTVIYVVVLSNSLFGRLDNRHILSFIYQDVLHIQPASKAVIYKLFGCDHLYKSSFWFGPHVSPERVFLFKRLRWFHWSNYFQKDKYSKRFQELKLSTIKKRRIKDSFQSLNKFVLQNFVFFLPYLPLRPLIFILWLFGGGWPLGWETHSEGFSTSNVDISK